MCDLDGLNCLGPWRIQDGNHQYHGQEWRVRQHRLGRQGADVKVVWEFSPAKQEAVHNPTCGDHYEAPVRVIHGSINQHQNTYTAQQGSSCACVDCLRLPPSQHNSGNTLQTCSCYAIELALDPVLVACHPLPAQAQHPQPLAAELCLLLVPESHIQRFTPAAIITRHLADTQPQQPLRRTLQVQNTLAAFFVDRHPVMVQVESCSNMPGQS